VERRPPCTNSADVESFYHLNRCSLAGKVCNGTACFVARHLNPRRWARAEQQEPRVYCLGQCFTAPATARGRNQPHVEIHSREAIVLGRLAQGRTVTLDSYTARGGYVALEKALRLSPEEIIEAIEISGLRGRGGAGFPAGRKWRSVRQAPSTGLPLANSPNPAIANPKYVIANADEGDPGAYIDHFLIEDDPFALLEGMTIAAQATGATQGFIYVRAEHLHGESILLAAIAEARNAGWLGERVLGTDLTFDIEVVVGRGSYVCGEETALIRSIEGKRPEVQARPPLPAEHGLWAAPTLVNNVETLVTVPWIIERGGEAYRSLGFSQSRGTKVVSLNSLFRRPGLYEVEFGTSVRQIVEEFGGGLRKGSLRGVLIGGPLAGVIPPRLLDTRFGFEELRAIGASVGHGGVVAFDDQTSIPELMRHVFSFGAYESCGKCTPCRLGSRRVEGMLHQLVQERRFTVSDAADLRELVRALKWASLCGHGTGLAEFAESVLRYYPEELQPCIT
jgi:NADH:ubiquinone oxidoreductase subunit F (NADH-binding)